VSKSARLWSVLAANLVLVGALVVVGLAAHSIGVYAEGVDYLGDAAAIGVSLFAIRLAERPSGEMRPSGSGRATSVAALVNAGWLLVLSLVVAVAAVDRLAKGVHQVHGLPVLIVSGIAALLMLTGAILLGGDTDLDGAARAGEAKEEDLNMRAVVLETSADAAAAAGVAVTGAIIYATGKLYWLDPTVALIISAVVGYHVVRLLAQIRKAVR
jgi:cation diffusion facilitator family transporter